MDMMKPIDQKDLKNGKKSKDVGILSELMDSIKNINDSKIFAGLMIIILNIASRFVNIKLSKTVESYLKNSFSRTILVFAIAWMGTRDLWVALGICIVFIFCMDYFFNEESAFCILPETFTDYHVNLIKDEKSCKVFTKEDVEKAIEVLTKARDIVDRSSIGSKDNRSNTKIESFEGDSIELEEEMISQVEKPYFKESRF
jgi:hypothetical protein